MAQKITHIQECKEKIEALYEGLFSGPTPGTLSPFHTISHSVCPYTILCVAEWPEEEEAERRFLLSETDYTNIQSRINKESTALVLLVRAEKALRLCIAKAVEVRSHTFHLSFDVLLMHLLRVG